MNRKSHFFLRRRLLMCASIACAIFSSTPARAQQKSAPLDVEANRAAAGTKAIFVLSKPGSYVLQKNLTDTRPGVDAVQITVSNVTVDLQGFLISGGVSGTGVGVNATGESNVVVRNGTITNMGGAAIVTGPNARILAITASADSSAGTPGQVIQAGNGSSILDNVVSGGNAGGVLCGISGGSACLVRGNIIQGNAGVGLTLGDNTSGYAGNVLQGFSTSVTGGTPIGTNLCNGSPC
jgi:hypothetical protein